MELKTWIFLTLWFGYWLVQANTSSINRSQNGNSFKGIFKAILKHKMVIEDSTNQMNAKIGDPNHRSFRRSLMALERHYYNPGKSWLV